MLGVIFFPEVADYDSLAGAGMYKLAVLEVDAYVCHFFAGSTAGEEHQISLTQVAAGDFAALFQLPVCASRQTGVINFLIQLRYQSGAVRSTLAVTACTIGGAYPSEAWMYSLWLSCSSISTPKRTDACARAL